MPRDAQGPGLDAIPAGDSRATPAGPAGDRRSPAPGPGHGTGEHRAGEHGAGRAPGGGARPPARRERRAGEPGRAGEPRLRGSRVRCGRRAMRGSPARGERADRTRGPATANGSHAADLLHPGRLTYPEELAAASLLASGILAALGRRRREQLWQRAFGRRVVAPEGQAALAESALRAGAHEPSARLLDRGLRYLSHAMSLSGRIPPAVVAAHLSHDNLDLWMTPADLDAPAPWTAVGDGEVWRLPSTALGRVDIGEVGDALYPGLVSLGTDGAGRVLVDVEAAHGVISVTGPQTMTIAVLSAMALELATSGWSDRMHITLAGFGEDLTALAPDRITAVPTLEEALPALETHAIDVAEAMAAAGVSSVLEGRALGVNPHAWVPHYLISAVPPSPRERSRLLTLARVGRAAAAGYVVAGDVPGASWAWEVTPEGRLLAGGLGFEVQAQLTPARQHEALVGLFTAAAQPEGVPLTPPPAQRGAARAPGLRESATRGHRHPGSGVGPGPRPDRTGPCRPGHRARGLPGCPPRRSAPQRAERGSLAPGRGRRSPGRGRGPGHRVARHGQHRTAAPGRGRVRAAPPRVRGAGGLAGVPGPGGPRGTGPAGQRGGSTRPRPGRWTWCKASCSRTVRQAGTPGWPPTSWSMR